MVKLDLVAVAYFIAAALFIIGLKRMSHPATARGGILWAGAGMAAATLATFFVPFLKNIDLIIIAIVVGSAIAYVSAQRVKMTDMPQMIALYNGMGGGAAAAIAAIVLIDASTPGGKTPGHDILVLATVGALIGAISFSGSLIAFAKLQGWIQKPIRFVFQQPLNLLFFAATVGLGVLMGLGDAPLVLIVAFFASALVFGVLMTIPIGGADMPVVISLYNAFTGLAVALEGYVLKNPAMIIAGMVVGAAGTLLTQLMAKAMNRPISNVLFSSFGSVGGAEETVEGSMKPIEAEDAAVMMAFANTVVIVPGYGMAVAHAQHKVWELSKQLADRGVTVKFAIHPVAGRMPGHMNVLLAEAGVPYDKIFDLDEINDEFPNTDVALVIGANDVVNPVARTNPDSPIYGMPILNADKAKNVIIVKRGRGAGFSGIENALFYQDNARMLYGDGQEAIARLINAIKQL